MPRAALEPILPQSAKKFGAEAGRFRFPRTSKMPGANCSIFGCTTSRYRKGISVFKVPIGDDTFNKNWRDQLVNIVTKDRKVNDGLKQQIQKRTIHICELHFEECRLIRRELSQFFSILPVAALILHCIICAC